MKLSPRLEALLGLLVPGVFLSDVGSDHALLLIEAYRRGLIVGGQGIDNKKGPFSRMKEAIETAGYAGDISASLSSGLDDLDPFSNMVALCGMGGELISEILEKGKDKLGRVEYILVDAHSERGLVQDKLIELGYRPDEGEFVHDGPAYYSLERWKKGVFRLPLTPFEREYGFLPALKASAVFKESLKAEVERAESLLDNDDIPQNKKKTLKAKVRLIERYLHENP